MPRAETKAVISFFVISAMLLKTHEFEKRLKRIEKTLKTTTPGELAMRYNPALIVEEKAAADLALR